MSGDLVEEGKAKAAGIISILIGVTAFIELICGFIYLSKGGPEGSGLWSGVGLAIICALGIVTWLKRSKTAMVFHMVMCIIWFIVCIVQVIIAFVAWVIWHLIRKVVETNCYQIGDKCHCNAEKASPITVHNCDDIKVIESCFLTIMIISAFAAILTLAGSIIDCMGTCCARPAQANVVVVQQPAGYPMVIQQQQQYPGQAPYPGQQPVVMAGPPPDYGQGIPEKQ
ncbi:hypothetical protein OS493_004423 [Desmophyllum pertusum]|uniref:Uncharacterized protein n=1 Tax=Desmophyllum pertusum TaxID=174260 RepID=A0A9W9ZT87_9CNID|nr:hypothetical protein OS493_004423 [Desmophyllum pertusum]